MYKDVWEVFYTESKLDEDRVDQISIDVSKKRYILDINADDMITDWVDEYDNYGGALYVSRFVFDLIISGLEKQGFKSVRFNQDEA